MPIYIGFTPDLKVLKVVHADAPRSTNNLRQFRLCWLEDDEEKHQVEVDCMSKLDLLRNNHRLWAKQL